MENTGQIVRSKKTGKSRYTPISNEILQSQTLTPEEKSILVHLLSLPEDWVVYKTVIWQHMNIGRNRFNSSWKTLVEKGYIVSIRVIDANTNLVKGWNHIVYEEPVLTESCIDQSSDLPKFGLSENRVINKVITEQSNNQTKEEVTKKELSFETIWTMYNKRGVKQTAKKAFDKLRQDEKELLLDQIPKYIERHKEAEKMDFIPHLSTYLNQKRFNDDLPYQAKERNQQIIHKNVFTLKDYE